MLMNLIGGFIVILIGTNLTSVVADGVALANANADVASFSGSTAILGLVTIFFAIGVMSAGVALAMGGLRNAGLI